MLAATLLGTTAGAALAEPVFTWTAGPVGGGWHDISTGLAKLLRDETDLEVKVLPGGGAQNPVRVDRGDAKIGMGMPPLLAAAVRGEDPYRGKTMANLRALAGNMSLNVFHFYVAADSPFARMTLDEIFRGRKPIRLAIPRPGTSDVWILEKIMEFYGLCAPGKTRECYQIVGGGRGHVLSQLVRRAGRRLEVPPGGRRIGHAGATGRGGDRRSPQNRALKLLACPPAPARAPRDPGARPGRDRARDLSKDGQRGRDGEVGRHGHDHHRLRRDGR